MPTDTPLLVPIHIDALLVNGPVAAQVPFERWTNNWSNLNSFEDPVPPPWGSTAPVSQGVHLHWQLPGVLTRGQAESGSTQATFPYTPNRWLVVRLTSSAGGTAAQGMTAWIIESDYLDPNLGTTPYLDPSSTAAELNTTRLGRHLPIKQWDGELLADSQPFLTATGIAQATFLGYQPGLLDVYSFYDDTTALPDNTVCTYLVAGWYANAAFDPLVLHPEFDPAQSLFTSLSWQVLSDAAIEDPPNRSVFHGLVNGLVWQTETVPPRVDSDARSMQVAVAYTAIDALSAVLAQADQNSAPSPQQLEMMLAAFGYDALPLLDEPDATAQLETRIRQAWFGATPGGTLWQIVPVAQGQTSADPLSSAAQPAAAPLTPSQAAWLAALNTRQRQLDVNRRDLATMQGQLFSVWWKLQYANSNLQWNSLDQYGINEVNLVAALGDQTQAGAGTLYTAVAGKQMQVVDQQAELPDPASAASIGRFSQQIPDNSGNLLMLRPSALPAFQHPVDPVVLIAGITPPSAAVDASQPLPCRLTSAAVTGDTVVIDGNTESVTYASPGVAALIQQPGSLTTNTGQPLSAVLDPAIAAALQALSIEAFFADPNNAASIASNGLSNTDSGVIAALAAAIAGGTAEIAAIPDPLQASFAFAPWQQAWNPLYLEWNLQFYPTVQPNFTGQPLPVPSLLSSGASPVQDNLPMDLSGWSFNGSDHVFQRGSEYYSWTGGDIWSQTDWLIPQAFTGRSSLTPNAETLFVNRLSAFIAQQPVASATAVVTNGVVTSVTINSGGSGYSVAPTLAFSGGAGSGAAAVAEIADGAIVAITVTSGGSGYTTPPQIAIAPGDWVTIQNLIDAIGETRFLSQTLSGFNANMIMQQSMHSLPADPYIAGLLDGQDRFVPNPTLGDVKIRFGEGQPFFFPARGGFFSFNQLQIVDGFGQVLDLLQANGNSSGLPTSFQAILGAGLTPNSSIASAAYQIQQAPRLVQPSRLNLRWLDSFDDGKEVFLTAGATPVCGWLIPNHLDRSIAVYSATGDAMGELLVLMQAGGAEAVTWLPAPDSAASVPDPSQIPNPHLRGAILAFTALVGGLPVDERVMAFRAWFQSIDETLWTIDPPGGQTDADLAVLIGRPLAVVRLQVSTELYGQPAYNQSWRDSVDLANTGDPNSVEAGRQDAGLTALPFAIQLGSTELLNDGLIGYFVQDTYTAFNAVHAAAQASPYINPIGGANTLSLPFSYPAPSLQVLTALIDPRGSIHATTGVLPTAEAALPAQFYAPVLAKMAVSFRIGPVLTAPDPIRLPVPVEQAGAWSWIWRPDPASYETEDVVAADAQARLADAPPHLMEGWLMLAPPKPKQKPIRKEHL